MSVNTVNSDGSLLRVAGGTVYADAPIGEIHAFGGTTIPNGYLLCNGQAVSRTNYAELFTVIGTAFGEGDGETTFNVPDLRDKSIMGVAQNGTLGESQKAQLPNIVAALTDQRGGISGAVSGAFYKDGSAENTSTWSGTSGNLKFDASRKGASVDKNGDNVYTNNGEVRTANVRTNFIIKAKQTAVPFDVAEYIRNQNVLSDIENIALSTNANNPTIFEYDGEFICYLQNSAGTGQNIYIKDDSGTYKQVGRLDGGSGFARDVFSYPVKKGWQMYATGWQNGVGQVAYYKLRDYTGR